MTKIFLSWYTDGTSNYLKANPAWVRTVFLDPETLTPVKDGETGVIAHYDLANWNSCIGILTEDLGHRTPDGFLLQGRAKEPSSWVLNRGRRGHQCQPLMIRESGH